MSAHPSSLRVVTWNVGEVYWPWQGNELKDRDVEVVREAIAELAPDVVLLQEIAHAAQLEAICAGTYAGKMAEACRYDRHVAILVRRSLAPRFADHILAPSKRGAVEARFTWHGDEVRAMSLHFDVFARPRRLRQALAAVALLAADAPTLTIAGGDFNYDPTVSARVGYDDDLRTEAALAAVLTDAAPHSGPTLVGLLRVDRLFAGGARYAGARAFTSPHRTPLGDHAPLVCDVSVRP